MRFLTLVAAGLPYLFLQVALRSGGDADLVRRLKARQPKAMSDLYNKYGQSAYSIIFRIVRSASVAEDLLHETLLHIWNRASSFDGELASLGAWVLTIARTRAIESLRATENQGAVKGLDHLESADLFHGIDPEHLSADTAKRVRQAFAKLSEKQKLALALAYFEGASEAEMAEKLKQPIETIREWTHEALASLRSAHEGARFV
ncbi:MAG: sigma-70 family RNA polymerase sigma factor [Bryobacteraceae bacterium]